MPVVWRILALSSTLIAFAGIAGAAAKCPAPAKPGKKDVPTGTSTYNVVPPLGDATPKNPIIFCFYIPDPNNAKKTIVVEVPIPDPNGNVIAKWDPTKETAVQASARKAAAIKAAVQVAIKAGDLPGVTVDTKQLQVPVVMRNPTPPPVFIVQMVPGYTAATYGGVTRQSVVLKTDPSKQAGGGLNFMPGQPGQPSPGGSSSMGFKSTMCGPGAGMGSATGFDPSGNPSLVGFGFYDGSLSTSMPFITAITPSSGETDAQVFNDLAQAFNSNFSSQGYHASYDPITDRLTLDPSLPSNDIFWFGNSDTGLDLCEDAAPAPIFSQCPSFGMQTGGNILLAFLDDGSVSVKTTGQTPYDGVDDNLVCVANASSDPVFSLPLSSPNGIFAFDGDGVCDFAHLTGCPFGSSGYEGPGVSFSGINGNNSGSVNFSAGLAPGAGAYFSLEASIAGTAYLAAGSNEGAFTTAIQGPDTINLSLPGPPMAGQATTLQAEILANTVPVPNQTVVFNITGSAHFSNSDPGSPLMSTVTTDDLGKAKAAFVIDAASAVMLQASIPGSMLTATLNLSFTAGMKR